MCIRFVVGSLIALVAVAPSRGETPLGTAFTYQGQLKNGGVPLDGTADFQFTLWDAAGSGNPPTGGIQVGGVQAINALQVTAGLFTATLNDGGEFGGNAFNGNARWLQIAVRSPAGGDVFTTLAPRQQLKATPYALQTRGIYVDPVQRAGIGTLSPTHTLTLQSTDNLTLRLIGPTSEYGYGGRLNFGDGDFAFLEEDSDDNLTFRADRFAFITGDMGIGTTAPASKLDIAATGPGAELLRFSTERPWVFRQIYSGPSTGLQLLSTVGQKPFEITAVGGENVATFFADGPNSRVGIGTTAPNTRLTLSGGPQWTSSIWTASMNLQNGSAIGWEANASGQRFGIGQSTGGLYFFRTYAAFEQTIPPPNYDLIINDNGNVVIVGAIDIGYEIVTGDPDAVCPAGKKVLGGGCNIEGNAEIRKSYPSNNGWHCEAGDQSGFIELVAYAICAKVK